MLRLQTEQLKNELNSDAEFRLNARKWEGRFRVSDEERAYLFQVHEGQVERITEGPDMYQPFDFSIHGPTDGWEKLLRPEPEPFYQDIYSAWVHHGFVVEGDLEQFFGFHMALRRMQQLLRLPAAA